MSLGWRDPERTEEKAGWQAGRDELCFVVLCAFISRVAARRLGVLVGEKEFI